MQRKYLDYFVMNDVITLTEPNTPLYDANHVGLFDFIGRNFNEREENPSTINDARRTSGKSEVVGVDNQR